MVANRQSLEDHIEPITPCLRFFLEAPYLFINNQGMLVLAIYISPFPLYNTEEVVDLSIFISAAKSCLC